MNIFNSKVFKKEEEPKMEMRVIHHFRLFNVNFPGKIISVPVGEMVKAEYSSKKSENDLSKCQFMGTQDYGFGDNSDGWIDNETGYIYSATKLTSDVYGQPYFGFELTKTGQMPYMRALCEIADVEKPSMSCSRNPYLYAFLNDSQSFEEHKLIGGICAIPNGYYTTCFDTIIQIEDFVVQDILHEASRPDKFTIREIYRRQSDILDNQKLMAGYIINLEDKIENLYSEENNFLVHFANGNEPIIIPFEDSSVVVHSGQTLDERTEVIKKINQVWFPNSKPVKIILKGDGLLPGVESIILTNEDDILKAVSDPNAKWHSIDLNNQSKNK